MPHITAAIPIADKIIMGPTLLNGQKNNKKERFEILLHRKIPC
jgi:hypothetical protein